ncbi:MAG: hypothetical protein RI932_608 [Pseudomonadota bacterium]|jgi:predicted AAA+ superfamily ATPase
MIERSLKLLQILGDSHSSFLFGARGVGKTHLANQWLASKQRTFSVSLLEPEYYERYLRDPGLLSSDVEGALKNQHLAVLIDEIQKLPALLDVVHYLYEKHRKKIQFLLTGSSARKLKRQGANLLAGRALSLRLFPLDSSEYSGPLERILRLGTLPGIILDNSEPERSLRAYVHTYLREEIQLEALVRKVDTFARFLEIAGQHHGKIINASNIAKPIGTTPNTVLEYFRILEDTLLGFSISGWHESTVKQLRTAPKFFLFDNGVANALRGELRIELSERTSRFGELFETYVIQEIFRKNEYEQLDFKLSYWQTSAGQEVDILLSRGLGAPIAAIEIKSAKAPDASDLKSLVLFAREYPKSKKYCFCRTPHAYRIEEIDVEVIPWRDGIKSLPSL